MVATKVCRRCGLAKPLNEMKSDKRNGDGYSSFCKECHKAASVAWQKANPEKVNATRRIRYEKKKDQINVARKAKYSYETMRWARLQSLYGVSKSWYESTLLAQKNRCAVCGKPSGSASRMFAVDHDHSCCPKTPTCGKCNRGILCHHCNVALHNIEKNDGWLESVVKYLKLRGVSGERKGIGSVQGDCCCTGRFSKRGHC